MKTQYAITHSGYTYDAAMLMNSAQIISTGTDWIVRVVAPQMPSFTVVSVCRRGAVPSILFRDGDGDGFRLKSIGPAATIATRLLDRAFRKPFNREQLAAQNEVVASQDAPRTVQLHEAPTASPSRGRKITDGDISINGRTSRFYGSVASFPTWR